MFGKSKAKEQQQRVVTIINKLLEMEESSLEARFQKTHGKVAISYKDHKIEIIEDDHGEKFKVKYAKSKVCLSKKQYAKVMASFNEELSKRSGEKKDFSSLESLLQG